MPVELFYSYAHEDEALRDELEKHLSLLKRSGLIVAWHDRRIGAGEEWRDQIDAHARSADIILLLVSPDFLASDYCYNIEMELALGRYGRHEAIVIPIILRPVDWSGAPFAHLQALPQDAKPVTLWANRDEAFLNIAQGIRELVLQARSPTATTPAAKREPQERILDAAMPSHIVKDQTTELQVLIRLPDSAGLRGVLQNDADADARPEDVLSKEFPITFPRGLDGSPEAILAQVTLTAPDFTPSAQTKQFIVPPDGDSEVISFFLTALRIGKLKVLVELQWEDVLRGARRLLTECAADASATPAGEDVTVARMPLTVLTTATQGLPRPPAASYAEYTTKPSAATPAQPPCPQPMNPQPTPPVAHKKKVSSPSKAAWIGASGAIAAAMIAGIFSLYNGSVSQPPPAATKSVQSAPAVANVDASNGRVVWEKNWRMINDARKVADSQQSGGLWSNKEELLQMLHALDLSTDAPLAVKRDQLITRIERAETEPNDPTNNLHSSEVRAAGDDLKREIRNRAMEHGVDVTSRNP